VQKLCSLQTLLLLALDGNQRCGRIRSRGGTGIRRANTQLYARDEHPVNTPVVPKYPLSDTRQAHHMDTVILCRLISHKCGIRRSLSTDGPIISNTLFLGFGISAWHCDMDPLCWTHLWDRLFARGLHARLNMCSRVLRGYLFARAGRPCARARKSYRAARPASVSVVHRFLCGFFVAP